MLLWLDQLGSLYRACIWGPHLNASSAFCHKDFYEMWKCIAKFNKIGFFLGMIFLFVLLEEKEWFVFFFCFIVYAWLPKVCFFFASGLDPQHNFTKTHNMLVEMHQLKEEQQLTCFQILLMIDLMYKCVSGGGCVCGTCCIVQWCSISMGCCQRQSSTLQEITGKLGWNSTSQCHHHWIWRSWRWGDS